MNSRNQLVKKINPWSSGGKTQSKTDSPKENKKRLSFPWEAKGGSLRHGNLSLQGFRGKGFAALAWPLALTCALRTHLSGVK